MPTTRAVRPLEDRIAAMEVKGASYDALGIPQEFTSLETFRSAMQAFVTAYSSDEALDDAGVTALQAAVASITSALGTKASQTAVDAAMSAIGAKASQDTVDALGTSVAAAQTMAQRGDLKVQIVVPTNASTITSDGSLVLMLNHTAVLLTATIVFPAAPRHGQQFIIGSKSGITTLTLSASKTLLGAITSLALAGWARWVYVVGPDAWVRIG